MRYYECHITIEANETFRGILSELVIRLKWKFSAIDGDIVLGDGVKFYATRHFNEKLGEEKVLKTLLDTAEFIRKYGFKITRRKVEMVIWDDRSSKVQACNGACIECHLDDLKTKET